MTSAGDPGSPVGTREPVRTRPWLRWVRYPLLGLLGIWAVVGLVVLLVDPGGAAESTTGRVFVPVIEGLVLLGATLAFVWWVGRRRRRLIRRLERLAQLAQSRDRARGDDAAARVGTSADHAARLLQARRTDEALAVLAALAGLRDDVEARHGPELLQALTRAVEDGAQLTRAHRRSRDHARRLETRRVEQSAPPTTAGAILRGWRGRMRRVVRGNPSGPPPWARLLDHSDAGGPRDPDQVTQTLRRSLRAARVERSALPSGGSALSAPRAGALLAWVDGQATTLLQEADPELAADLAYALAWVLTGIDDDREVLVVGQALAYAASEAGVDWAVAVRRARAAAGPRSSSWASRSAALRGLESQPASLPSTHEVRWDRSVFHDDRQRSIARRPWLLPHALLGAEADTSLAPLAERLAGERTRHPTVRVRAELLDPVLDEVTAAANLLMTGHVEAARTRMDAAAALIDERWGEDELGGAVVAEALRLRGRP